MFNRLVSVILVCISLSLIGCGGGEEATAPGADELTQYINENPESVAAQEEIDDEEDVEQED